MKRFIKYSLFFSLILGTACEKKLDVIPTQSLSPEKALATEGDLVGVVIGAYDAMQNTSSYGGDIQLMGDLWANRYYLRFRGSFNGLLQIASVTNTSNLILLDNPWATSLWGNAYRVINASNLILENLSLAKGNIRPKNTVEGEALFMRGSMYFELARLFGKTWGDGDETKNLAVPLILKSTSFDVKDIDPANYPKRATVAEIYAQAISDLTKASTLLPDANAHYATKWAALAQLSRIALMKGDFVTARDAANQVIASGKYSLTPQFGNLFYNFIRFGGVAPLEYIFYIKVTPQDGTNGLNTYYGQTVGSIPGTAGRGDMDVQTPWVNLHESNDVRRAFFIQTNRRLTQKHLDRYGHVPVIRLAEMYLTRAEANSRLSTTVGATPLDDINVVRRRAGLPDLTSVTLAQISRERQLELAFEGHFLWDLKRNRLSAPGSSGSNGPAWNSQRLIMPIPQREMDVNKNLEQNEGYK